MFLDSLVLTSSITCPSVREQYHYSLSEFSWSTTISCHLDLVKGSEGTEVTKWCRWSSSFGVYQEFAFYYSNIIALCIILIFLNYCSSRFVCPVALLVKCDQASDLNYSH